jgi:hypothetical protein
MFEPERHRKMMLSHVVLRAAGAAALAVAALAVPSCATEESVRFGEPDGGSGSPGETTGGVCDVNPMCKVSFANDIFKPIIDGSAGCTGAALCHGGDTPQGDMILKPGDAHGAYTEIVNYQLKKSPGPAGSYVEPCDKKSSRLLCNSAVDGAENPYGHCGTAMPFGSGATKLTSKQLETIAEWIVCGAPEN